MGQFQTHQQGHHVLLDQNELEEVDTRSDDDNLASSSSRFSTYYPSSCSRNFYFLLIVMNVCGVYNLRGLRKNYVRLVLAILHTLIMGAIFVAAWPYYPYHMTGLSTEQELPMLGFHVLLNSPPPLMWLAMIFIRNSENRSHNENSEEPSVRLKDVFARIGPTDYRHRSPHLHVIHCVRLMGRSPWILGRIFGRLSTRVCMVLSVCGSFGLLVSVWSLYFVWVWSRGLLLNVQPVLQRLLFLCLLCSLVFRLLLPIAAMLVFNVYMWDLRDRMWEWAEAHFTNNGEDLSCLAVRLQSDTLFRRKVERKWNPLWFPIVFVTLVCVNVVGYLLFVERAVIMYYWFFPVLVGFYAIVAIAVLYPAAAVTTDLNFLSGELLRLRTVNAWSIKETDSVLYRSYADSLRGSDSFHIWSHEVWQGVVSAVLYIYITIYTVGCIRLLFDSGLESSSENVLL